MTTLRSAPPLAGALLALLLLAGCSSAEPTVVDTTDDVAETPTDTAAEEPTEELDACAALEGVDLAVLLGETVGEIQAGSTCRVSPDDAMSAASITLSVFESGGEQSIANQRGLLEVTSEPALGDEAFLANTALAKGLDIRVGDQHVSIRVHRQVGGAVGDTELIAVGETALAHLGW